MDVEKLRQEILIFLRNSDILSTTQRGVTTKTDSFTATAGQTEFTLTSYTVRNIRSVIVDGTTMKVYSEFTPTYNQGSASVVTLTTGASEGVTVAIQYDYSSGTVEKVWPDYPQKLVFPTDLPRLGFDFLPSRTTPIGIGDVNWLTDYLVRIKLFDAGTYKGIDSRLTTLREKIKASQKSFYHFQLAVVSSMGPVIPHEEKGRGTVFERYLDMECRFGFET